MNRHFFRVGNAASVQIIGDDAVSVPPFAGFPQGCQPLPLGFVFLSRIGRRRGRLFHHSGRGTTPAHTQHTRYRLVCLREVVAVKQHKQIKAAAAVRGATVANEAAALLMVGKAESVFTAAIWAWLVFFRV